MKHIKYFKEKKEVEYHDIDDILKHYLEAALWTNEGDEGFEDKTIYDFSEESTNNAKNEIEWFVKSAGKYINDISDESIGHDIWLTRNGHGTGFWDRGYSDKKTTLFNHLCDILGSADAYVGDDEKVYINSYQELPEFDLYTYMKELKFKGDIKKYNV
jgi:hypothetical protein